MVKIESAQKSWHDLDDGVGVGHHLAPVIHDKAGKILRPAAQMDHVVMAKVRVGD